MMKIPLTEWAARHYNPPPSSYILRSWANSGQIFPVPEKVGKTIMVDENAARIPLAQPADNVVTLSPRAKHILEAAA